MILLLCAAWVVVYAGPYLSRAFGGCRWNERYGDLIITVPFWGVGVSLMTIAALSSGLGISFFAGLIHGQRPKTPGRAYIGAPHGSLHHPCGDRLIGFPQNGGPGWLWGGGHNGRDWRCWHNDVARCGCRWKQLGGKCRSGSQPQPEQAPRLLNRNKLLPGPHIGGPPKAAIAAGEAENGNIGFSNAINPPRIHMPPARGTQE